MAGQVMVLNATWEPISHTKLSRAIAMVRSGVAVIHEVFEGEILRTASGEEMPKPKVLRLLRYVAVKVLHQKAKWTRKGVILRDKGRCGYCRNKATTVDHVLPTSRGGVRDDWCNTVACCHKCNNKKGNKTPQEASMALLWELKTPRKADLVARVNPTF